MRLIPGPITVRRSLAAVAVFAALLGAIRAAYEPRLYGVFAQIQAIPAADRNPVVMTGHARRLASPEVLAAASADPGLPSHHRPIRAARGDEVANAASVPSVYPSVSSIEDGTISLVVDATSADEANAVASAVIAAYIGDQGAGRIRRVTAGTSNFASVSRLLSRPWEAIVAVGLSALVSTSILILPVPRAFHGGSDARACIASAEGYLALTLIVLSLLAPRVDHPSHGDIVVGAVFTGITFGLALGGVRFGKGGGRLAARVALGVLSLWLLIVLGASIARWEQILWYWRH